ncbi:metallophosphoesterase [soil metagenome]
MSKPHNYKLYFGLASLSLAALALGLFYYGTRVETRRYRLERLKVKTKSDTTGSAIVSHQSLKILHLSDLHLSGNDDEKVEFIRSITDQDYDLIVLTGDIFEFLDGLKYGPRLLSRQPRLGAYAVFGNHDYYDYSIYNKTVGRFIRKHRHPPERNNIEPHRIALEAGGFKVLVNQSHYIPSENLFIAGIDYPGIKEAELQKLMLAAPLGALKLGLFHLPRQLDMLARAGLHLAFGGHTHGGQVRLPGVGAIITDSELSRKNASGLFDVAGTKIHISRGLGADPRSNIRLFCPPAATVIELSHERAGVLGSDAVQSFAAVKGQG